MQVLTQHEDGSADVKLSRAELLALGACIWATREDGFGQAYERFFPSHDEQQESGVTDEEFSDAGYELYSAWCVFVDMG